MIWQSVVLVCLEDILYLVPIDSWLARNLQNLKDVMFRGVRGEIMLVFKYRGFGHLWCRPLERWFKLNTDGWVNQTTDAAARGELLALAITLVVVWYGKKSDGELGKCHGVERHYRYRLAFDLEATREYSSGTSPKCQAGVLSSDSVKSLSLRWDLQSKSALSDWVMRDTQGTCASCAQ
ncbi:hypothetical protein Goari_021499 [Gossypium aridum]|uniref:Uncharacterized protein n=1 Tax=Gossypium aridum TaxID=34290 RepID=A0A7J8YEI1_GOSAI|nr:hypothetical protein [Gossypium aridum]